MNELKEKLQKQYQYDKTIWIINKVNKRKILSNEQLYFIQDLLLVDCLSMSKITQLFGYPKGSSYVKQLLIKKDFNPMSVFVKKFQFIRESLKIHNEFYTYHNTNYIDNNKEVIITCPVHSDFLQKPKDHLKGEGCVFCDLDKHQNDNIYFPIVKKSKGHNWILDYCHSLGLECHEEWSGTIHNKCINPKTNRPLKFDIYIPYLNLVVEFHHKQHYSSDNWFHKQTSINNNITQEEAYELYIERDQYKQGWAIDNNIQYLEIPYTLYEHNYSLEQIFAPFLQ